MNWYLHTYNSASDCSSFMPTLNMMGCTLIAWPLDSWNSAGSSLYKFCGSGTVTTILDLEWEKHEVWMMNDKWSCLVSRLLLMQIENISMWPSSLFLINFAITVYSIKGLISDRKFQTSTCFRTPRFFFCIFRENFTGINYLHNNSTQQGHTFGKRDIFLL